MKRNFLKGYAVATYPCNNIYETVVTDKYGRMLKSVVSFTFTEAERVHEKYMHMACKGNI